MNINSGNIGELAGNPSILDKKERNHFEGIVFTKKIGIRRKEKQSST